MTQTGVTWRFTVSAPGVAGEGLDELLEEHLDCLMEELLKLEECNPNIHDPSVGGSLAKGEIEIELSVSLPADQVVGATRDFIRTAIHAAGGFTPMWDQAGSMPATAIEYEPEETGLAYA